MPSHTLAFWENRIREDHPDLDRSMIKKTAKLTKRKFDRFTHEPSEQELLEHYSNITYQDPTGEIACGLRADPFETFPDHPAARRLAA